MREDRRIGPPKLGSIQHLGRLGSYGYECAELTVIFLSYTPPFDRHDWLIDRCGKQVRYVIDFYTGKADSRRQGNMAFYLDVRPAVDDWEGVRTRVMGWWHQWSH